MNIGKKAAFLSAVAGTLVLGGAGAASAHGFGDLFEHGGSSQHNKCSTSTGITTDVSVTAKTGETEISSNCINVDETGRAHQSNECDTSTGPTANIAGLAPTGETEISSNCANIAAG